MIDALRFLAGIIMALQAKAEDDAHIQFAWRRLIGVAVSGLIIVAIFSFVWMHGWVPGLSGVALADDMNVKLTTLSDQMSGRLKTTEDVLKDMRVATVRNALRQALEDRCHAQTVGNGIAYKDASDDIDDYMDQYRDLTGHEFRARNCEVILIKKPGTDNP